MNLEAADEAFLAGWLTSDPTPLTALLQAYNGHGLDQLRGDLDRFAFLLGGNDGEPLFQPDP